MTFTNVQSEAALIRWHLIFVLLSIEKTAQFWSEMGLPIQQTPVLKEIARIFVQKYRLLEKDASLSESERLTRYQELFQQTFERITHEESLEVAEIIYEWGNNFFQNNPEGDIQEFLWSFLFRRLAGVGGLAYPLIPLELSIQNSDVVKSVVVKHFADFGEIQHRLSEIKKEPMSPWEEYIYRTYTKGADPMDWVENTIIYTKSRATWIDLEKWLGKSELEALLEWGKKQAKVMEMPPELISLPLS